MITCVFGKKIVPLRTFILCITLKWISMLKILHNIGEYCLLMGKVFRMPDKGRMFWRQMSKEMEKQGLESILITLIVSVFMGAIMTLQTKLNTENPLLPAYSTGLVTRDCILLEFSSTILCLLLAGKVGSNMASEIGTMRITEQIDAMEIMGVNSANYLILPKIVAFMVMMPLLVTLSMFTGLLGGYGIVRLRMCCLCRSICWVFSMRLYRSMCGTRLSRRLSLRLSSRAWRRITAITREVVRWK